MGDFLDRFDKISTVQKLIILALAVTGIFVAVYMLVITPIDDERTTKRNQITDLRDRLAQLRAQAEDIEQIRNEIRGLCERQESFLKKLPPQAEISSLLQSIHQQAQLVGLDIDGFERLEDVAGANYTTIPVDMRIGGTYDQIADFFYFIGRQERIVNVNNIDIRKPDTRGRDQPTGTTPVLRVSCLISTYYSSLADSEGGDACEL